jgi:hypothetical protein
MAVKLCFRDSSTVNADLDGTNSGRTGTSQTYTVTTNPESHPEQTGGVFFSILVVLVPRSLVSQADCDSNGTRALATTI